MNQMLVRFIDGTTEVMYYDLEDLFARKKEGYLTMYQGTTKAHPTFYSPNVVIAMHSITKAQAKEIQEQMRNHVQESAPGHTHNNFTVSDILNASQEVQKN